MDGCEEALEKARETTAQLFLKIDRNHDNRLSKDEFISAARSAEMIRELLPGC